MSGGFFRGTSADQDTRFSNKQAKLLKTQKFAPELDHLVDTTKVKMDVMKPWIATRVTELLGFEDEVLINFIYGLLEGKDVNGKEVQISLTGFMEKHTAKFMKELWTLLLSAQKNASGVPQQFLDAKEEEARKKKLEADRIASEIQKKQEKESRELYHERLRNMDGAVEMLEKDSSNHPMDEKEDCERNDVRGRTSTALFPKSDAMLNPYRVSRSPRPAACSPPSLRGSPSRSISKSHSNSRSYSDDRHRSRSISRSPKARRRTISPRRRSITPRRRHSPRSFHSPSRRLSYSRRRSRSYSPRRSPSPLRRRLRSPFQCKSPLPLRRRSPSLVRLSKSPSPAWCRRSPSPAWRRRSPSPIWRRRLPSPVRRCRVPSSTQRRISPSPARRRRSPPPARRRRSPSLIRQHRSPLRMRRASPSPLPRRSPSLAGRRLPSPMRRSSPSPERRQFQRSPLTSPSPMGYRSPVPSRLRSPTLSQRRSPPLYEPNSPSPARRRIHSFVRMKSSNDGKSPVHSGRAKKDSLRSPQRDPMDMKDLRRRESGFSPLPERSPIVSESPPRLTRKNSTIEERRSFSPDENPVRQTREQRVHDGSINPSPRPTSWRPCQDGPEKSKEDKEANHARADGDHKSVPLHGRSVRSSTVGKQRDSPVQVCNKKEHSPGSERLSGRSIRPETFEQQRSLVLYEDSLSGDRQRSTYLGESKLSEKRNRSHKNNGKDSDGHGKSENATVEIENVDRNNRSDSFYSGSDESDEHKTKIKGKRKHKKHDSEEVASDVDLSELDKEEAKRRKKEEKKLRREEKRRRRDKRRRRKEERRAAKLKMKNQSNADASDDELVPRRVNHPSDDEESAQKKLEIELRHKALESIKAKRNRSH